MSQTTAVEAREMVDAVYRSESRHVLATLIRLLGDFDLAEEAMHEAFASAVEQWPREGVPGNPRAWLVSAGRFKGDRYDSAACRGSMPRSATSRGNWRSISAAVDRRRRGCRGRSVAFDLHVLPPCPVA